jgi:hypothetical protein
MGLFDYINCKYKLPDDGEYVEFQTGDTPSQSLDRYEIREDGTLFVEEYDTEDRSDPGATGLRALAGCMTRVNKRWTQLKKFTGEISFAGGDPSRAYSAYFVKGELKFLTKLDD